MKTIKEAKKWAKEYAKFHRDLAKKHAQLKIETADINQIISAKQFITEMTARASAMEDFLQALTGKGDWANAFHEEAQQ